jgi:hypothetical protein
MARLSTLIFLVALSVRVHAAGPLFDDESLVVLSTGEIQSQLDVRIDSVRILDESSFEIRVTNNTEYPVSLVGTIIFYDSTGTAFFLNGSLDVATGEIVRQAHSGHTIHVTRCIDASATLQRLGHGSYHCVRDSSNSFDEITQVLLVITDMYVDRADRD